MNKTLQKYSGTLTLVFPVDSKKLKTTYVMRNSHLYVPNKGIYVNNHIYEKRTYFNTIGKNYYWLGTKGLENEDFSDEGQCQYMHT